MPRSGEPASTEMDDRQVPQHFFREVLKDPFVIFALAMASIVILLVPFFATGNAGS